MKNLPKTMKGAGTQKVGPIQTQFTDRIMKGTKGGK